MSYSEADTRSKLIDPALYQRGWTEEHIKREETAGEIVIINDKPRKQPRRIDYTLRVKISPGTQPVAVALIEAKAEHLPPTHGLEQAKGYARLLHVPFVFTSNGHQFVEYDFFTGNTQKPQPMRAFPSPQALQTRYETGIGFSLTSAAAKPLLMPYTGGEARRRYYQDAAIRAVLEHIAQGHNRALLALATGAGKTFLAVSLLKRIADAGQLRKALFICDRDELRTQADAAFQNLFGSNAAKVTGHEPQKNARVLIATYQTLGLDSDGDDASFLHEHYPDDYFSHIIIDECHRSAWGTWSEVLTRNSQAVQIGLTATPRKIKLAKQTSEETADLQIQADNYHYFGEPVYEYEMGQGMADGYLAACEIIKGRVNIDATVLTLDEVLKHHPVNAITGAPAEVREIQAAYTMTSYEDQLLLPDRVAAMTQDLFNYFVETGGPEQKTIIFCARDSHAAAVATGLDTLYRNWCDAQGVPAVEPYAFKCTAESHGGDFLPDFRGSSRHHFIATTVDLLTTGVDVPIVQNIVFFRYVRSPISFYQMVGRGTRLDVPSGKLMFRVYDYTNATDLFGAEFLTRPSVTQTEAPGAQDHSAPAPIMVEGFEVVVTAAGRSILVQQDGKAMPVSVEAYKEQLAAKLVAEAPTLEAFRTRWIAPDDRQALLEQLPGGAPSARLVRELEGLNDYDLYDVLGDLGYGLAPRTRVERAGAFAYKQEAWMKGMPARTAATVRALASQFAKGGTDSLENPSVFQTPEVVQAGGLVALKVFGKPAEILHETKARMFAA